MKLKRILLSVLSFIAISSSLPIMAQEKLEDAGDSEIYFFQAKGDNASGRTVVILPGGGYVYHAMDHEGFDWVPFFNSQGINVAILKYKYPEGNPLLPLNDVKSTFKYLRDNSEKYNVNPENIGVMGFSAGGHLASTYATHWEGEEKPAFQILFYPVISFKSDLTHQGSRDSFLGENQSEDMVLFYSNENQVNSNTPPAILFHSGDDGLVVPENSINYYLALNKAGIPASLHIYPVGEHGWGYRESFPYHDAILKELSDWFINLPINNR